MANVNIRIGEQDYLTVKKIAESNGVTISDHIRNLLKESSEQDKLSQLEERTAARIRNLETQLSDIQQVLDQRIGLIAQAVKVISVEIGNLSKQKGAQQ